MLRLLLINLFQRLHFLILLLDHPKLLLNPLIITLQSQRLLRRRLQIDPRGETTFRDECRSRPHQLDSLLFCEDGFGVRGGFEGGRGRRGWGLGLVRPELVFELGFEAEGDVGRGVGAFLQ